MRLIRKSPKLMGAIASDTDMRRLTSSGSKSQTVVPSSTRPARLIAPLQTSSASARVVLPAPPCPTSATFRILADGTLGTRQNLLERPRTSPLRARLDRSASEPIGGLQGPSVGMKRVFGNLHGC